MIESNNGILLHFSARRISYYCDLFVLNWVEFLDDKYQYVYHAYCMQWRRLAVIVLISKLCNSNTHNRVQSENMLL